MNIRLWTMYPDRSKKWGTTSAQGWSFPRGLIHRLRTVIKFRDEELLQPFGGYSSRGITCDLDIGKRPTVLATAENLPFRDGAFKVVLLDPPYNQYKKTTLFRILKEGARVANKYLVCLHWMRPPQVRGLSYLHEIVIYMRSSFTRPRILTIFLKR